MQEDERRWRRKDKNSTNLGGFFFYRSVNSHPKVSYKHYIGSIHWQAPFHYKEGGQHAAAKTFAAPFPSHQWMHRCTHCNTIADLTGMRLDDSWMGSRIQTIFYRLAIAERAESVISENLIYIYDVASLRTVLLAVRTFMNGCLPGSVSTRRCNEKRFFVIICTLQRHTSWEMKAIAWAENIEEDASKSKWSLLSSAAMLTLMNCHLFLKSVLSRVSIKQNGTRN